jgi:uncharacterized protein
MKKITKVFMQQIILGKTAAGNVSALEVKFANRHGLIAGATGTGKTVTLQRLAEGFSKMGVPVFLADVKGDLSGICMPGSATPKTLERLQKINIPTPNFAPCPTTIWDLNGKIGIPLRATISEVGPVLLGALLGLSDAQQGVLNIAFAYADDNGMLLIDIKDLKAILNHVEKNAAELKANYGNITSATVASIQREILALEMEGAEDFFGEPAINIADLIKNSSNGEGLVNLLAAQNLINKPKIYAIFLLWLLSELFENLPEQGDSPLPKFIFFFDEAHLLFSAAPKALLEKVTQFVKLIRSKGVGVYFITQNPQDIPEQVLAQLSNRIQHALRAYTPHERKAVKAAADSFRENPQFKTADAITELAVGEALVSVLQEDGIPSIVERILIAPPASRIGAINDSERAQIIGTSPLYQIYVQLVDRESAFEILNSETLNNQNQQDQSQPEQKANSGWTLDGLLGTAAKATAAGLVSAAVGGVVNAAVGGSKRSGSLGGSLSNTLKNASKTATKSVLRSSINKAVNNSINSGIGENNSPNSQKLNSQKASATRTNKTSKQTTSEVFVKTAVRSVAGQVGRQIGRQILRGLLGGILK